MNSRWLRKVVLALTAVVSGLLAVACGSESDGSDSAMGASHGAVSGLYENANDNMSLDFHAGNKVTVVIDGDRTELTWEMDGADKVVVHGMDGMNMLYTINSDGNLSDAMGMGGVFRKK